MDGRLSRHRTPSRTRREIFPALFLLALALTAPLATPPPARAQAGADSVTITWTAPGDDGNVGTAQSYEVRISQANITASNWSSAFVVPGAPDPLPAGTHQSMVVHGLTNGVTYYIAIKAKDDAGNVAPLSNVVRWDWNADTPPPANAPATTWNLNPPYPNPGSLSDPVNIPIDVPPAGPGTAQLQIVDGGGHLIRRLDLSGLAPGSQTVVWDGKNSAGRLTAPGIYTAWLVGGDAARSLKIARVP
jgi:hypothetical protein